MTSFLRFKFQWLASVAVLASLLLLTSVASFATQLRIQPGDIVCTISEDIPLVISANGDVSVTITDSETCLPQPVPPATPMLSREVLDQNAPGEVRLTWSSSATATSCQATSIPALPDWTGAVPLGQNQTRTISGLAEGNYSFSLTCSNSAGSSGPAQVSATIFSSTPSQCDTRPPPNGWTRLTNGCKFIIGSGWQGGGSCTTWEALFGGSFTEIVGLTQRLATNRLLPTHYLAIEFNTGNLSPTALGSLTSDRAGGMMEFHRRIYSISTCPGDFNQAAVQAETGCYGELTAIFHLFWGGPQSARTCKLQPNTTYYLNMIGTDSPLGTPPNAITPNCPSNENCGAVYDPQPSN